MKVAIVHDWLVTYAGAERVPEDLAQAREQGRRVHRLGPQFAPAALAVIGGLLTAAGGWAGPETRDVDMQTS